MAEVLKEWLTERLQRTITWEAEEFGNMMKNGYIIASLLLSYHVINDEKHFLIRSSNAVEDIKNNWRYLSEWLRQLEIELNHTDLKCIKDGKGSTLLRLFYQLFLSLDKRDRTNYIKRERKYVSCLVEKVSNRFKIDKVGEEEKYYVDYLSKPLLNEKHFIEWQRKKAQEMKDTYDYVRHKYSRKISKMKEANTSIQFKGGTHKKIEKERIEMEKFSSKYPCKFNNYTYEQLLRLEEQALERKTSIVDSEWTKNYMNNLYSRMQNKSDSEEFQKQIANELSESLWDVLIAEEESKFDSRLAKNVMKLSQFEKQMCTQIMETKQQARNLAKSRMIGETEFADQREQQFNQFLDNIKEQIQLELVEIDFEKRRQDALHKKLYAEKMKRKREHYYEICYDTMLSIVDYITKYAYFKRLIGDEIPEHYIHEWKLLYYKQQPIFDILESLEDILKDRYLDEEVSQEEEEEVIRLELARQETLNESEFNEYHNYSSPWTLDLLIPNYDPETDERKYEYLGFRILGHVVYTLLEIKYPYSPPKSPADLPEFTSKALLRGLPDRSICVAMQVLLNFRKIHVVRLETAINFCLRKFKAEMIGCIDIELSYDKFTTQAAEEESKELIKLMKIEDDSIRKTNDANLALLGTTPPNAKQTQTPKTIPEEEIKLSTAADLGRYAYEALSFGDSLTDHLLAAIIVEYLKDQNNILGFVIINYPNSYQQAQILEETFSGNVPPDEALLEDNDDIYLEESIAKHRKKEKDQYKDVRQSKLVLNPNNEKTDKTFQSYFTCYIQLKETEDILQEFVIWDLTEDNSEFIDRFYSALGINYSMYYEVIEKDFLAQVCKYIIGDFAMPLISCDKLFGENILNLLEFPTSDDKKTKSKIVKPEVANGKYKQKTRRGSKASRASVTNNLAVVKSTHSVEEHPNLFVTGLEEEDEIEHEINSSDRSELKILPGEEEWEYGVIPIPKIIGTALATCWEEIEKSYIHDMQQLFLSKRIQMNCLVPYARFIKDKIEQIITAPSIKQDLVSEFQKDYNNFENDWRNVNFTKNEWHCRVKELQNKLYHICDERKILAEQNRQSLICENWTTEELTTMVNTYISCMQAELNRSFLTFQILHDFYYTMIKHMPPSDRITSKDLTKIFRESDETSGSKKGGEDKVYKQLKSTFQDMQLHNIEIDYSNNPFNMIIENNVKFALKSINDANDSYRSLISREYGEIAKMVSVTKKKDENTSEESVNPEEIFKENALKCIEEWMMAVNGEMFRASLRIIVLQYKCYRDMKLFNDHIYKTFMDVQNDINAYYLNEIKSVDRLCKYFQMAVEEGKSIPESLILEHDTFVIDPNLLQYAPPEPPTATGELLELTTDTEFKISQLARLRSQFKIVAPTGIALQQAFIYLIQDFIFFCKESCEGSLLPETWQHIDPEQIPKLVYALYGDTVYVDWRDFLIYCLNMRFPTTDELLSLRSKFRCFDYESTELITRDYFIDEEFWFDQDFDADDKHAQLRKTLIKHFLFELYETEENMMNYSAFLLEFSKSPNPIEGFTTALSMAVGKKICYALEECQEIVNHLITMKKYKDECLACALDCTQKFLDNLIVNVINICEGITITELQYSEALIPDRKGKKGKGLKAHKTESFQSTRIPKNQNSLASQSKLAQSTTDVKMTFICRPCEEQADATDAIEELPIEKEEIEEEVQSEPQHDPNLVYAVSQSVIWNVLEVCLPWHFKLMKEGNSCPYVDQIKKMLKQLEVETDNGDIYVCKFVSNPYVCKLLHKVKKFTTLNIIEEVRKVFL